MKKQRVLALLLALSLTLSTNGVTALAAAPDLTTTGQEAATGGEASDVLTRAEEEADDDESGSQQTAEEGTAQSGNAAQDDQSGQDAPTGDEGDHSEKSDAASGDHESDVEKPDASTGDNGEENEKSDATSGDHENDTENPDALAGDADNASDETGEETQETDDGQNPDDEITDDTAKDDDLGEEAEKTEEEQSLETPQRVAPRMLSFQDEVGMRITYDANETYTYTVDESGTLTQITKADGNEVEGNVVLDEKKGIKRIASGAFTGNTKLTYIKLPAGLTTMDQDAFKGCTALRGMTIPTGVTDIGESAFEGCSSLTQFALPATVERIGNRAFYGDSRLFMVYMKSIGRSKLQSIGDSAFYGCTTLVQFCSDTSFTFPDSLTSIGEHAFQDCRAVKSIVFADNISSMGAYAFASCNALTEVELPRALTAVPQYGFADCHLLSSVVFGGGNYNEIRTIGAYAFQNCYKLGSMNLLRVNKIERNAYLDCTSLIRVEIPNMDCNIEDDAFPDVETLYLIGWSPSTAETYTKNRKINFIATNEADTRYYKYKEPIDLTGSGKGKVYLTTTKSAAPEDLAANDPNKANSGKGVEAGKVIYVSVQPEQGSRLVSGSLKCNGAAIVYNKNDGWYSFTMPTGGAVITAEFEDTAGSTTITGTRFTYEFSNGSDGDGGAELKIGQETRLFLLDVDNNVIPTSKVKFTSDKPTIVKVTDNGVVTALKEGLAHIEMRVTGVNGEIIGSAPVHVSKTDVASLDLKADTYDPDIITITEQEIGGQSIQIASMGINAVNTHDEKIVLKALAYDADLDDMAVALKWSSSDSKVAKLAATSTGNGVTTNTVTIPQNASGEATITVSATNADKKTVSQKLIIQVQDKMPRLSATSLTLNPNKEEGVVLRVITAYGVAIDPNTFQLVQAENDTVTANDFKWEYDRASSSDSVYYFKISPRYAAIEEKTYNVKVSVDSTVNPTPVKISVKSSMPNPKVSFDKKQPKINLFYANDGTEVKPVITNLGSEKVSRYTLEPLSTDPDKDDRLFTENFQIDEETGVITQKNEEMILTEKNKLIVTGYLVLHFEGYKENAVKKYKITIPTQTVKPSYKLDRTSDTYNIGPAERQIVLTLMDTKTKQPVELDTAEWTIEKSVKSKADAVNREISFNEQGQIVLSVYGNRPFDQGTNKVVLSVRNNAWAKGKAFEYTYNIKASTADPKIKLRKTTVNLNSNYTEQVEKFYLDSNQCDTLLADNQNFEPAPTAKNADQFEWIHVNYADGVGSVSVDSSIKPGSYKFKCEAVEGLKGELYNAVTLTVKVVNTLPSMTVKGSPALNLSAMVDGEYTETAELTLNAKLPEGYTIDSAASTGTIECTTKGTSDVDEAFVYDKFDWEIVDNKLLIRLKDNVSQKKYAFTMKPVYTSAGNAFEGKAVKFTVRVYKGAISVKMTAKGALNLLDRSGEYTLKNSIVYTPKFTNLQDTIEEVQIFDAAGREPELGDPESEYFYAEVLDGKVYVAPRPGVNLENKKTYPIKMWVRPANYGGSDGMWVQGILNIKTAQVLPKVTADRSDLNLYLSNKGYEATYRVTPKAGSIGQIVGVEFGEKDEKSQDSFEIRCEPREDGSADIKVKLQNTVSFAGGSTNKVKMYVVFEGQGTNTVGLAITMNIKINK